MAKRTIIRNARWVVGWQGDEHRLIPQGTVVIRGDCIEYVGTDYQGPWDEEIDASGCLVIPGLISIHSHLSTEPINKGFLEDRGSRKLGMSGLFEFLPVTGGVLGELDKRYRLATLRFSIVELLKSGCTTVVELGRHDEEGLQVFGDLGIRAYVAPMYRSGRWYTPNGHDVRYEWDEEAGRAGLREAIAFIEANAGRFQGRLQSMLAPAQVDTCTEELLRETKKAAERLGVRIQLHAAQSTPEFAEMVRRHGLTPVQWLDRIGFLGPEVILGHTVYLGHHSQIQWKDGPDDLRLLVESGTSVAHCPWVFARRGLAMESFARYVRAGVNVALGTDTCPADMGEEMRVAAVVSKLLERDTAAPTAAEVFTAATVGGARALGRDDLGRLAPGCKADLALVRLDTMAMAPARDPIKSLVYYGASRAVDTVMVNGQIVVRNGRVPGIDEEELCREVAAAQEAVLAGVSQRDWAGRDQWQLSPMSLPLWG